jgi:ribosomal protein S18 acetylase RimI-like enzyme
VITVERDEYDGVIDRWQYTDTDDATGKRAAMAVIQDYAGCGCRYIYNVRTVEDFQRQGRMRALLTHAIEHTPAPHALHVERGNDAAINLYLSLGFVFTPDDPFRLGSPTYLKMARYEEGTE